MRNDLIQHALIQHAPADQAPEQSDPRWQLVRRIAASPRFKRAAQLRAFLTYICGHALAGKTEDVPESQIAVNVLHRRGDFNPSEDNIVRVQARQLRRKLQEYFENEGAGEELILTIPKGQYLPEFATREPVSAREVPVRNSRNWKPWIAVSTLLALILITAIILRRPAAAPPNPLWSRIFVRGQKTNIVVSDTSLVMMQMVLHSDITLREYLSHDYPANLLAGEKSDRGREILNKAATQQYADFGDFGIANSLSDLGKQFGVKSVVRYARNLNIRDFKNDNFILSGSRRSIPWDRLFEPQLGYLLEYDTSSGGFSIRDRASGAVYRTTRRPDGESDHYGVVAMLPNLGANGSVLLLMGLTMEGVEGSSDILQSAGFPASIARAPGCGKIDFRSQWFEMLVRTQAVSLASSGTEILACRAVTPSATN
jgi:hypothetical protein